MTRETEPDASRESRSEQRPSTDGARWRSSSTLRPDGGGASEAAGADDVALDPWGSSTVADYRKLFETFGIEEFEEILAEV
ncbi:MAG TPA: tryptophan--tRNA ligase, partial [Natrialbaceae archaeon]|nr:tryptophan--tRNA ligase [Natrialbaceae archaeon]